MRHDRQMLRRASLSLVLLAACAAPEDDWVVRPPGGGTGSMGVRIDGGPADAGLDGGGGGLTGLVCVVDDLRQPDRCPIGAAATGVLVRRLGDVLGATSGSDARFTLAVTEPTVILDVAADSTTLQLTIVPVRTDGGLVHAPVPTAQAWTDTVASLEVAVAPGNGAIAVYTDSALGAPAAGVTFVQLAAGSGPFYDGAASTTWTIAGGTGDFGATLFVDLPPGIYGLDGNQGARQVIVGSVPVVADAVTFVRAVLPP